MLSESGQAASHQGHALPHSGATMGQGCECCPGGWLAMANGGRGKAPRSEKAEVGRRVEEVLRLVLDGASWRTNWKPTVQFDNYLAAVLRQAGQSLGGNRNGLGQGAVLHPLEEGQRPRDAGVFRHRRGGP